MNTGFFDTEIIMDCFLDGEFIPALEHMYKHNPKGMLSRSGEWQTGSDGFVSNMAYTIGMYNDHGIFLSHNGRKECIRYEKRANKNYLNIRKVLTRLYGVRSDIFDKGEFDRIPNSVSDIRKAYNAARYHGEASAFYFSKAMSEILGVDLNGTLSRNATIAKFKFGDITVVYDRLMNGWEIFDSAETISISKPGLDTIKRILASATAIRSGYLRKYLPLKKHEDAAKLLNNSDHYSKIDVVSKFIREITGMYAITTPASHGLQLSLNGFRFYPANMCFIFGSFGFKYESMAVAPFVFQMIQSYFKRRDEMRDALSEYRETQYKDPEKLHPIVQRKIDEITALTGIEPSHPNAAVSMFGTQTAGVVFENIGQRFVRFITDGAYGQQFTIEEMTDEKLFEIAIHVEAISLKHFHQWICKSEITPSIMKKLPKPNLP